MEDLIPFLAVIAYIVLTIVSKVAQNRKKAEAGGRPRSKPTAVDQMLREMMRQAGIPEEQPVASERRVTASEHHTTVSEHRPTLSETRPTVSEHRPTPSEIRPTFSEHVPRASEHVPSPGESLKGDAVLPPIPKLPAIGRVPTGEKGRRRSRLASSVAADLHGGGRSLARALVLREIRQMRPELPVIVATGYANESAAREALRDSASIVQKPYDPDALVLRVLDALDASGGRLRA